MIKKLKKLKKREKKLMFTQLSLHDLIFKSPNESCGTFDPSKLNTLYAHNISDPSELPELYSLSEKPIRKNCTFTGMNTQPYIWHTHVVTSRFYPSYEDLRKVIKHKHIKESIIYTPMGQWTLEYLGDMEWNEMLTDVYIDPEIRYKHNINEINFLLDQHIYNTFPIQDINNKGYNQEWNIIIFNYITYIQKLFGEGYKITFTSIPEHQYKNNFII